MIQFLCLVALLQKPSYFVRNPSYERSTEALLLMLKNIAIFQASLGEVLEHLNPKQNGIQFLKNTV